MDIPERYAILRTRHSTQTNKTIAQHRPPTQKKDEQYGPHLNKTTGVKPICSRSISSSCFAYNTRRVIQSVKSLICDRGK